MNPFDDNIILSYNKIIPFPNNYDDLKEIFLNYFGESGKHKYMFFLKDKSNTDIEIKKGDNLKDIIKEKLIYVKMIEDNEIDCKEIKLEDLDAPDVESIDCNLDKPIQKLTEIKNNNEKDKSQKLEEIIQQLEETKTKNN